MPFLFFRLGLSQQVKEGNYVEDNFGAEMALTRTGAVFTETTVLFHNFYVCPRGPFCPMHPYAETLSGSCLFLGATPRTTGETLSTRAR